MELNLLRCLTCGGDLSFIDCAVTAKCVYCGSLHSGAQSGSIGQKLGALLILAEQCQLEQKRIEAHTYYNRAIELDPTNAQAWIGRGLTESFFSEHSFDKAVEFAADPVAVRGRILSILLIDARRTRTDDVKVYAYLAALVKRGADARAIKSSVVRLAQLLNEHKVYFSHRFSEAERIERFVREISPGDEAITLIIDDFRFQRHLLAVRERALRKKTIIIATIVASLAGTVVGVFISGPTGAVVGAAIGACAGILIVYFAGWDVAKNKPTVS